VLQATAATVECAPALSQGAALAGPLATVGKACLGRSALFELERPFY